jgi:hypothetical protein
MMVDPLLQKPRRQSPGVTTTPGRRSMISNPAPLESPAMISASAIVGFRIYSSHHL